MQNEQPRLKTLIAMIAIVLCSACLPAFCDSDEVIDNADMQDLINRMAHQPELMNLNYLRCYLGTPEDTRANRYSRFKHYIWCRSNQIGGSKYELSQQEPKNGIITESTFLLHTDDIKLDLPQVEQKFGENGHKFFDQQSCPAEEFTFVPNTEITFIQKQNSFQVTKIIVHYKGPGLPPVAVYDMNAAHLYRRTKALAALEKTSPKESIALLQEHLSEHPDDLEAQLALANSYKSNFQLNEAINQYTLTLSQAQALNDQATTALCLKSLQDLRLAPSVAADTQLQKHQVKLMQKGQRFHIGDLQTDQNNAVQPGAPAGTQAGTAFNPSLLSFPGGVASPGSASPSFATPQSAPDFRKPAWMLPPGRFSPAYGDRTPSLVAPAGSTDGAPPGTPPGEPF